MSGESAKYKLRFQRLSSNSFAPTRGSLYSAGHDLYSAYDYIILAKSKEMVKTDIAIALPQGCYGRIAPRSSLAWKNFIDVGAGVIDADYRGNICVLLFNHSEDNFVVHKGDRIAQLICEQIADTELVEEHLDQTDRADAGFGSTGISLDSKV